MADGFEEGDGGGGADIEAIGEAFHGEGGGDAGGVEP